MKFSRIINAALSGGAALIMMAAGASAATITYSTNAAGTGFSSGASLVLNSSLGAAATLTYVPLANIATGVPSNVSYGNFNLVCPSCSTQEIGAGSFFDPFTFDLIITDQTDGAAGTFVGSSTGGSVWSDVSQITVNWAPLQLGPGIYNATSGDFAGTTFSTTVFTGIVAPNSGTIPGQSTVQGYVDSTAVVPEPSTLGIIGGGLLGLSLLRRKVRTR